MLTYQKNGVDTALRQSMTDPSGTTSYTYDGRNWTSRGRSNQTQRTQAATTTFNNSALGVASATTTGSTDSYTRDNRGTLVSLRAATGNRYYYLFDGLGSVVGLVNSTASKVNSYSYDPYGKQLSASEAVPNPWRYAGGYYDTQTGLTKFGTRYYDPDLGRFTQRDPILSWLGGLRDTVGEGCSRTSARRTGSS